jgi:hypothetical protein
MFLTLAAEPVIPGLGPPLEVVEAVGPEGQLQLVGPLAVVAAAVAVAPAARIRCFG